MIDKTATFKLVKGNDAIKEDVKTVYEALQEKGYDPISQIIGYILSEDPTYITSHNGARNIMTKIDRFDLLKVMIKEYIEN